MKVRIETSVHPLGATTTVELTKDNYGSQVISQEAIIKAQKAASDTVVAAITAIHKGKVK